MMVKLPTEIIHSAVEGLKAQPLSLPLVIVNLMALIIVGYVMWIVADRTSARDVLITDLAKNCVVAPKETK